MKQYKLTITMPDDFQTGECYKCPLGIYDHDLGDYYFDMLYRPCDCRPCDCPLHEGQAIEEEYTD